MYIIIFFLLLTCLYWSEGFTPTPPPSRGDTQVLNESLDNPTQEWDADHYQNEYSFVWEYGTSLVELLQVKPGEKVLDIGCGSGELTAAIANANDGVEAMGMDSDPSMVKRAKEQYPSLTFFQGDVRSFRVQEPLDAIFSNAALHWVPPKDVDRSVMAMSNALKPGGRLVVELGGKGNVQSIVQAVQETIPGATSPWYFPSISEYTTILESHGLEVLSAVLFDRPSTLTDTKDGAKKWLRMFGNSFFEGMDENDVNAALDQIQDKLRPVLYNGTHWVADYRRLRIVAKKTS